MAVQRCARVNVWTDSAFLVCLVFTVYRALAFLHSMKNETENGGYAEDGGAFFGRANAEVVR